MKYRLGDICTITKGETGIMKAIPGAYTMVALGEANKTHNEFQFDTKAVIVPLVSSTGHGHASMKRVKYQEGKFALGSILCAVIPINDKVVLAKYLHIYLHWNREELLVSQMKGMANVSLPMNKIADVLVTVPSIEKQQEIIDLEVQLVEKELAVEKLLSDQLTQLENLNQAILQEAVQGKLVKQGPKDEPASELLKRIKTEMDNKIRTKQLFGKYYTNSFEELILRHEIPNNWTWVTVGSIADLKTGATPSTTNPSYYGGNIKWLVSGDIHGNEIFDCEKRITIEGMRNSNCTLLPADSILIALNGQGKTRATVALLKCEATCNQSLVAIIPYLNDYYHSKYIYYALKVNYYQIRDITGQTKRRGLNMKLVSQLPIPLPPLSEQKRIVEEIEKQFAKTKQLKEHIIANQQATEQLLKALLHQAFLPVPQAGEVEEMVTV